MAHLLAGTLAPVCRLGPHSTYYMCTLHGIGTPASILQEECPDLHPPFFVCAQDTSGSSRVALLLPSGA
jgi:hypothetical protein